MAVTVTLLAIATAALGASPAGAATVSQASRVQHGQCDRSQTCLTIVTTTFQAAPGEVNRVEVVVSRRSSRATGETQLVRFSDRGSAPLTAGAGCTRSDDGSVVCVLEHNPPASSDSPDAAAPPNGAEQHGRLKVRLGDRDDTLRLVDAAGHRPASLGCASLFDGGRGNDRIEACGTLRGGPGNDVLEGGPGNDALEGGPGNDRLSGGSGDDELLGGSGADVLRGGAMSDDLHGGAGNDRLYGGSGFDDLRGDAGDDRLDGGSGPDHLFGGGGDDWLWGGQDHRHDDLHGGPGVDRALRGPGPDTYWQIERFR
jgi:hypothetical protein